MQADRASEQCSMRVDRGCAYISSLFAAIIEVDLGGIKIGDLLEQVFYQFP
jgi:hypothetical protein